LDVVFSDGHANTLRDDNGNADDKGRAQLLKRPSCFDCDAPALSCANPADVAASASLHPCRR
jgi:hypothetical protein